MKKTAVRIFSCVQILLAMLSITTVNCWADEVIFSNGDRLTGKLINISNGEVTFNPELMGVLSFDISTTESISTDSPININYYDGNKITTSKIVFTEGTVAVEDIISTAVTKVPPQEVFSVEKPGQTRAANWTGSISAGLESKQNGDEKTTWNSILQLQRRTPKKRVRMRGVMFLESKLNSEGERETSEQNYTAEGRYDYFFKRKWFWGTRAGWRRDIINDLNYRIAAGSGLGYQWIDSGLNNLDILGGLGYTNEDYKTDEGDSFLTYLLAINCNFSLGKKLSTSLDATITPKLSDPSDFIASGFGEIRFMATEKFYINFSSIFEYTSKVERADSTDTKFILGVGWNFL